MDSPEALKVDEIFHSRPMILLRWSYTVDGWQHHQPLATLRMYLLVTWSHGPQREPSAN